MPCKRQVSILFICSLFYNISTAAMLWCQKPLFDITHYPIIFVKGVVKILPP